MLRPCAATGSGLLHGQGRTPQPDLKILSFWCQSRGLVTSLPRPLALVSEPGEAVSRRVACSCGSARMRRLPRYYCAIRRNSGLTRQMSAHATEEMSAVKTGQMSLVKATQMSPAETRQMSGRCRVSLFQICLVSAEDICGVSTADICLVSTADSRHPFCCKNRHLFCLTTQC